MRVGADSAQLLAVRRAALPLYYQPAESCDDSYGALGDIAREAVIDYPAPIGEPAGSLQRSPGVTFCCGVS